MSGERLGLIRTVARSSGWNDAEVTPNRLTGVQTLPIRKCWLQGFQKLVNLRVKPIQCLTLFVCRSTERIPGPLQYVQERAFDKRADITGCTGWHQSPHGKRMDYQYSERPTFRCLWCCRCRLDDGFERWIGGKLDLQRLQAMADEYPPGQPEPGFRPGYLIGASHCIGEIAEGCLKVHRVTKSRVPACGNDFIGWYYSPEIVFPAGIQRPLSKRWI
jgi:hypothetical protein